jgi:hypothetical protein
LLPLVQKFPLFFLQKKMKKKRKRCHVTTSEDAERVECEFSDS